MADVTRRILVANGAVMVGAAALGLRAETARAQNGFMATQRIRRPGAAAQLEFSIFRA
jgi:hypothetical protein